MDYIFSNSWFADVAKRGWDDLIPQLNPSKILEIGSYEGASTCYLISTLTQTANLEIHCVDTWEGGVEHQAAGIDMGTIQARFLHNTSLAKADSKINVDLVIHRKYSDDCLALLISEGKKNYFDFIYIDGSHQAPDVLCDAVLGFKLLRVGGVMAFDDYTWAENLPYGRDPLRCPKPAIDAFVNLNFRKLQLLAPNAPLYQLYIQKLAD